MQYHISFFLFSDSVYIKFGMMSTPYVLHPKLRTPCKDRPRHTSIQHWSTSIYIYPECTGRLTLITHRGIWNCLINIYWLCASKEDIIMSEMRACMRQRIYLLWWITVGAQGTLTFDPFGTKFCKVLSLSSIFFLLFCRHRQFHDGFVRFRD